MMGIVRWSFVSIAMLGGLCVFADESATSGSNCTFRSDPDRFLAAQARAFQDVNGRVMKTRLAGAFTARTVDPSSVTRRNYIDDEIFGKLQTSGVQAAGKSTDEEFFRRINLDLTGKIPTPADVRAFVADGNPNKRDDLVDKLLASNEFTDRWAIWIGDWLRNSASSVTSNSPQQLAGRNAMYKWIWFALAENKPVRQIAFDSVMSYGNNYDESTGNVNFISSMATPNGPIQDTYDAMLVKSATVFLGMGQYDCLLCHNGRGHLDALSLWGKNTARMDAEKMSAFFSRVNLVRWPTPAGVSTADAQLMWYYNSFTIDDVGTRTYDLNTTYGNRPNRTAVNGVSKLTPVYQFSGATPAGNNWRSEFAQNMVNDPMFSRNVVNRVWKQLFNLALADPVDGLDPARLDPANPPGDGWTFQATHPQLLEKMSKDFVANWYDLRVLIKTIVTSNAYQMSSRYDGSWDINNVPLFARHYPRRLEGEEVHDALVKATGVIPTYTQFNAGPVQSAMLLFDSVEPRSNGGVANFMNYFLRGNRDSTQRSQALTVQQQLALMNDNFVTPKLKVAASPVLQAIAKLTTNDAVVDEMFLTFISRKPDDTERTKALAYLAKATTATQKNAAIEDLAWVLVNKVDFLFSY